MNTPLIKAYFISDSTGLTVEALGRSITTQFQDISFEVVMKRFVNSTRLAHEIVAEINELNKNGENRLLIFSTVINPEINAIIKQANGQLIDFFEPFMNKVSTYLGTEPLLKSGASHELYNYDSYMQRIDAVDFTLVHDDGQYIKRLDEADIILVGISRTGKTPTSLYLSMHYGLKAANYPITDDDIESMQLPKTIQKYKNKLFGLTTARDSLQAIREKRRPGSRYASIQQCEYEIRQTEILLRKNNIPFLNTVTISIEEISAQIVNITGIGGKVIHNIP